MGIVEARGVPQPSAKPLAAAERPHDPRGAVLGVEVELEDPVVPGVGDEHRRLDVTISFEG